MNTGGLVAPADVQVIDEGSIASSLRGAGHVASAPTWGVNDPVATALSGLSNMVDKYAKTYDDVMVNDYTMQKSKELDELYNNPDTGIFNTRKGDAAKGVYQDYKSTIRDIWDKDAADNLSPRQRDLASKHLYRLFSDYGHRVAHFETQQLMGAQQERCKTTVQNAIDLMATGRATDDDIANSMNAIRVAFESMGQMRGWDSETVARMQNDAMSDGFTKASAALAVTDPIAAYGLLRANQAFMTPAAFSGAVQALDGKLNSVYQEEYLRRLVNNDKEGAEQWLAEHSAVQLGDHVARFESSGQGVRAIGYDGNGGTSYGKYQLSSKQGSYQEWIDYLAKQGPEGAEIASRLKAAGKANTGSRKGAAVDAYQKEAAANPQLFERTQREYIAKTHYGPMMSKLPADERAMIEGTPALQEMAWSIAVQHGGGGGASLLRRVWKPGMTQEQLVEAVYGIRGEYFGSSTKGVQRAVQNRFGDERRMIQGMLRGEYKPEPGALKPSQVINLQARGKTMIDKIHVDQAYEVLLGMDRNEAKRQLMTVEGQQSLGLDSEQAAILWRKITPYWNTVAKQDMLAGVDETYAAVKDLPLNDRDAKALEILETRFTDPTEFASAVAEYQKRMKREDKIQLASSWEKMRPVIEAGRKQGKSKQQIYQEILENPEFSDYDKKAVGDGLLKSPKENIESRKQKGRIMREANAMLQNGDDPQQVMSWAEAEGFGNVTQAQAKAIQSYIEKGGNVAGVTLSRCENLYKRLLGARGKNPKGAHLDDLAYALILDNLDPNETSYTDEKLAKIIADIMVDQQQNQNDYVPNSWFKRTIYEAVKAGEEDEILWDGKDVQEYIDEYMKRYGELPDEEEVRRDLAQKHFRIGRRVDASR